MEWSYSDLLAYGRELLIKFAEDQLSDQDNITGLEELPLRYLLDMYVLNYYMFTTGSTNFPERLFEPMWITGYLPLHLTRPLTTYLKANGIYYIIQDELAKEVLDTYILPDASLLNPKNLSLIIPFGGLMPDQLLPQIEHLFYASDPLVAITIEDPILERRTLYTKLIDFLTLNGMGAPERCPIQSTSSTVSTPLNI